MLYPIETAKDVILPEKALIVHSVRVALRRRKTSCGVGEQRQRSAKLRVGREQARNSVPPTIFDLGLACRERGFFPSCNVVERLANPAWHLGIQVLVKPDQDMPLLGVAMVELDVSVAEWPF